MGKKSILFSSIFVILFSLLGNSYYLIRSHIWILPFAIILLICINVFAGFFDGFIENIRLKFLNHGVECLIVFYISMALSVIYHIVHIIVKNDSLWNFVFSVLLCVICHSILFWNGIISVYATSVQLGMKQRIIGAICGPIPLLHLVALFNIIKITKREVLEETKKDILNRQRKNLKICDTKYPILMVHGVFFRDSNKLNYWGRIPGELERNGARLFYGEHQSALSVEESGAELAARVKQICESYGCAKLNVIAHSKGGLDMRYALSHMKIAPYIASLTTINTPHRGCGFADYLLNKIPVKVQNKVAATYNAAARKLGDSTPDFMKAVKDLTASACIKREAECTMPEGIYCQSFGSVLKNATHGKFPLNFSYPLVQYFDGPNDGLVSEGSFAFGDNYRLLTVDGKRGISHADMIDLNRENIKGFDVREFYVQLVADLKEKGL